jgi:DMSO reductase anchor subunit
MIYFVGFVLGLIFIYSYRDIYKNWDEVESYETYFPAMWIIITAMFGFFLILKLTGNLD